jgi:hypothetical protein
LRSVARVLNKTGSVSGSRGFGCLRSALTDSSNAFFQPSTCALAVSFARGVDVAFAITFRPVGEGLQHVSMYLWNEILELLTFQVIYGMEIKYKYKVRKVQREIWCLRQE